MEENPYASPLAEEFVEKELDGDVDSSLIHRRVRPPAIALIVVASLGIVLDAFNTFVALIDSVRLAQSESLRVAWLDILAILGGSLGIAFLHIVVIFGARKMLMLRNYETAMTAAVICMIPLCSPILIVGIPFGIWGAVVLLRSDVKRAFAYNGALEKHSSN